MRGQELEEQESRSNEAVVFNIQRFSTHDGPGIRTIVFLKGCPLQCEWCSNPESIERYPEIWFVPVKCIKGDCHKCLEVCPCGALQAVEGVVGGIDRSQCTLCMKCAEACPSGAIEQIGRWMTKEEVLKEIEKDLIFYNSSGGGVTFSGGEPALSSEFVSKVAKACKEEGIHVALETCGAVQSESLEKVLPFVDLVLYDVKHIDPQKHKEGTGVSNDLILDNLIKIAPKVRLWLRIPIIPGYNDSESHARGLAKFSRNLPIEKISLLPYHNAGERKYQRLGRRYSLRDTPLPTNAHMERLKQILERYGYKVTVGS